jgi:hypothetical protein
VNTPHQPHPQPAQDDSFSDQSDDFTTEPPVEAEEPRTSFPKLQQQPNKAINQHSFKDEQRNGTKSATLSASKGSLFSKQHHQVQEEEEKTATQEMMDAEEKVLYNHLECVKQEA